MDIWDPFTDTRMKFCTIIIWNELIPTLVTQLTIVSSVKAATPNNISVRITTAVYNIAML